MPRTIEKGSSRAAGKDQLLDYQRWLQDCQGLQLDFRSFTASELGSITEVSPSTQRDWRRRGIGRTERPAAGWNRYTFPDLVFFSTLRLLIDSGVSASSAAQLADCSVLPSFKLLTTRRGAVKFSPPDLVKRGSKTPPTERFVVAAAPEPQANAPKARRVYYVSDFSVLDSCLRHDPEAIASIVIDLKRVVDRICDRAPMPLLTVIDEAHEFGKRPRMK